MTAVEIHAIWERYGEKRLIAALNHKPFEFLEKNNVRGVSHVSLGLASYIVRAGRPYFDFRSTKELLKAGDRVVGRDENPFRRLKVHHKRYLDCLAAIRNVVVHRSDAGRVAYRKCLNELYNVSSAPQPFEFLNAIDNRTQSPAAGKRRI